MAKNKAELAAEAKKRVRQELDELRNNNDAKGFVDRTFQVIEEFALSNDKTLMDTENIGLQRTRAVSEILKEITEPDESNKIYNEQEEGYEVKEANKPFLKDIIKEFNKRFVDAVINSGKTRDDWERKIRNGEVPDTELIKDDPQIVKKLAHSIVLEQDPAGNVVMDAYRELMVSLRERTIDGMKSNKFLKKDQDKIIESACAERDITDKQYKKYDVAFGDRNPSQSIGYKVNQQCMKEGEPLFSELPDYLTNIKNCKTEEDLEAYEKELFKNKHELDLHIKYVKSSVKTSKILLKQLDATNKSSKKLNIDPTEANVETRKTLEAYTHIGTDFKYSSEHAPTDAISPAVVSRATDNISKHIDTFTKQSEDLYYQHKDSGTKDTPTGKESFRKAAVSEDIQALNNLIKNRNKEIFDKQLNSTTVNNDMKSLAYLDKYRNQQGFFAAGKLEEDKYTKSLDELTDSISDALINDCLSADCYDKLFISVMEQKRMYQKMRSAEKQGDFNAYNKYSQKFTEMGNEVKANIDICKAYEGPGLEERAISGKSVDRTELLDDLSKAVSLKPGEPQKTYGSYMTLHSGAKAGATNEEIRKNITKVISAYTLKKLGKPFSVKDIHKNAEQIGKLYLLDKENAALYQGKNMEDISKDVKSILKAAEQQRTNLYGIKNDQHQQFIEDMKKLKESMRSPKGRSTEYTHLYNTIKRASEINKFSQGLSSKQKEDLFCQTNMDVINAVQKYVKGKEKVRISNKGNDAFANSMDALSIVSKYTKQPGQEVNPIVANAVNEINTKRKDPELANLSGFENKYGAARANNAAMDRKIEEHLKAPMRK